jgi:hypothetical protein
VKRLRMYGEVIGDHAYFVVEDPMAGCKNVYTVYGTALTGSKLSRVIGRELPMSVARKTIQKHAEKTR